FPGEVAGDGESVEDAAARAGRAASGLEALGRGRAVGSVVHVFSHRREVYHVFVFPVAVAAAEEAAPRGVWVAPHELERYALPTAQRRILQLVEGGRAQAALDACSAPELPFTGPDGSMSSHLRLVAKPDRRGRFKVEP